LGKLDTHSGDTRPEPDTSLDSLCAVPVEDSLPVALPMPDCSAGLLPSDGKKIADPLLFRDFRTRNRYQAAGHRTFQRSLAARTPGNATTPGGCESPLEPQLELRYCSRPSAHHTGH